MGDYSAATASPFNTLRTRRTVVGRPAAPSRRRSPWQGEAGGVQGAGLLRCDNHDAFSSAGAAGVRKETEKRAGI